MNLKKALISLLLGGTVMVSLCVGAFALSPITSSSGPATGGTPAIMPEVQSPFAVLYGTITNVTISGDIVHVQVLDQSNNSPVILNVTKDTKIVDSVKRTLVAPQDLVVGSTVHAWHSPVSTRSYPPITNVYVMIVNIPKEGAPGQFIEVEKVTKNPDGSVRVLNAEQDLYLTIPKGTKLKVFGSDKTMPLSDIRPGTRLVAWFEVVAMSYPGQTGTDQVMVFPSSYDGYVSVIGDSVHVNGKDIPHKAILDNGTVWLPAQEVAKKLGFSTIWQPKAKALTLRQAGKTVAMITAGKDTVPFKGDTLNTTAPIVKNGRLYVDMSLFGQLGNFKLAHPVR